MIIASTQLSKKWRNKGNRGVVRRRRMPDGFNTIWKAAGSDGSPEKTVKPKMKEQV
jgi:hypothetical protein